MNRTEARRKWGEAYGSWYWANHHKGTEFFGGKYTKAERVAFILDIRKYRVLARTAPPEMNERGNEIYRNEHADQYLKIRRGEDRYVYDFKHLTPPDWKQFDTHQDASYFGMWVNVEKLMTFTYCEGDRILVVCPDVDHLRAELQDAAQFYGDPPPMAIAIDMDGKRTEYYDTRPTI